MYIYNTSLLHSDWNNLCTLFLKIKFLQFSYLFHILCYSCFQSRISTVGILTAQKKITMKKQIYNTRSSSHSMFHIFTNFPSWKFIYFSRKRNSNTPLTIPCSLNSCYFKCIKKCLDEELGSIMFWSCMTWRKRACKRSLNTCQQKCHFVR